MGRYLLGMFGQPAFARGTFTVLFDMPILWHDVLRGQGNDLGVSRAHNHRGDGGRIIERSDLIVTVNLSHGHRGEGVIMVFGALKPALVLQERWRLGEKDAKGAQGGILDGISGVWPLLAMVRQWSDPSVQDVLEGIEA